ncbi:ABC transporter ATP-binding protein [Pontibacillus marinus]|uniref:Spermidine/putrescine import ATP-binding protein PotA n=1 Tax=Pontibacillus marinus BH030004 = DSM 16465 TaxID=1385511 RepID=A0A0A5GEX5_9BACI|nr:ABC transporter ATP-binding protein [Pontibacillus marinus]KGX91776.1 spermidine/putrescine ABC transporter ATP-binding protein [Pontibacillus marinus BH030004 = DSM 16465]
MSDNNMVKIKDVVKSFGQHQAVKNVSIDIKQGEFLTLLGPSGCGKTTTLRMIAGFESITSGEIVIDGKSVASQHPYERDVNTVFQSYALFPHMSVEENIAFGLKMKKYSKAKIKEEVERVLNLVQLEGYGKRKPDQLSGGQNQRVAIARALVNNPKVLLLDEPLGALDLKLRKQMQIELKHLQQKLGMTFIYVTHDQEEALTMSDRIAVMNDGHLEQLGTSREIYETPKTKFVADFIGETNLFEGEVVDSSEINAVASVEGNQIPIKPIDGLSPNKDITLTIRPELTWIEGSEPSNGKPSLQGKYVENIYVGSVQKVIVALPSGKNIVINESPMNASDLSPGDEVNVCWDVDKAGVLTS